MFNGGAKFEEASFCQDAGFEDATFNGGAKFDGAIFIRATFVEATFNGGAWFHRTTIAESARFDHATFNGVIAFDESLNHVSFEDARVSASSPDIRKWLPPGWRLEPDGKGGGVLRRDPAHDPDGGSETGPQSST
ncbi:pentapeptide repeat-containing protein [Nonomuraea sp. KM90]|uniref:pentapeptide repeat-containing protein n=1 Tax=Nonomuraea sp. KM90 TaxID=3457428 RepID=UPI003FCE615A